MSRDNDRAQRPPRKAATDTPTSRYGGGAEQPLTAPFMWTAVDGDVLTAALDFVCDAGDACSFAVTRNGRTGTLTILSGSQRLKWYFTSTQQATADLHALAAGDIRDPDAVLVN